MYRVFPWAETAPRASPGHPLFVPAPQGAGRLDNPDHYRVLYLSDSPAGAVAEAFGEFGTWSSALFRGLPGLAGSRRALATYELEGAAVVDLDDAQNLLDRKLRPSQVVTRNRAVTRRWALHVFLEKRWAGVRWWSYYEPDWGSFGLWEVSRLTAADVVRLAPTHDAVQEAGRVLRRPWR